MNPYDIAIFGGGISGFSAALRLQHQGFKTVVLEAHGQIGGCAGFFTKKKFAFDVGATTLVDFVENGVGGNFLKDIGLTIPKGDYIDYIAWLPDRQIMLYRDLKKWHKERLEKLGATAQHIAFWKLMDKVTNVFWQATRKNIKLPIQNIKDIFVIVNTIGIKQLGLVKYLNLTMLDVLKKHQLHQDKPLIGLLSMLIEDTVHSRIDEAPFINAALGTTIRGAGLMRADGGMKAFWSHLSHHYLQLGGILKKGNTVSNFQKAGKVWQITTNKGTYHAKSIISSLPIDLTHNISPDNIRKKLAPFIKKNEPYQGGAIVVFLGVPESEVSNQQLTHHQILLAYDTKLGNGNNLFISVSKKNDTLSAPIGYRAVMISTHCEVDDWQNLSPTAYKSKKEAIGNYLIQCARRVYPNLGKNPIIYEIGTPLTYQKFTKRIKGSVGGFKQHLGNSNFYAVPQDIGFKDFWLAGDNTWPGLGTVAGLISGRIASECAAK